MTAVVMVTSGSTADEMTEALRAFIARARQENDVLTANGAEAVAKGRARLLADLEAVFREAELEALTLEQAAEASGYSYSAIEKLVRRGDIENVGQKGRPRVRRGDLPRKARRPSTGLDLADEILSRRSG